MHQRLTHRFLGSIVVAIVGGIGVLACLVFLYVTPEGLGRDALDVGLVVAGVVTVGAIVLCILTALRINAINRAERHRR